MRVGCMLCVCGVCVLGVRRCVCVCVCVCCVVVCVCVLRCAVLCGLVWLCVRGVLWCVER